MQESISNFWYRIALLSLLHALLFPVSLTTVPSSWHTKSSSVKDFRPWQVVVNVKTRHIVFNWLNAVATITSVSTIVVATIQ